MPAENQLFPGLHTLFVNNLKVNSPIQTIFNIWMGIANRNKILFTHLPNIYFTT